MSSLEYRAAAGGRFCGVFFSRIAAWLTLFGGRHRVQVAVSGVLDVAAASGIEARVFAILSIIVNPDR